MVGLDEGGGAQKLCYTIQFSRKFGNRAAVRGCQKKRGRGVFTIFQTRQWTFIILPAMGSTNGGLLCQKMLINTKGGLFSLNNFLQKPNSPFFRKLGKR